MSINASANLSVQVPNGPALSYAWAMTADAFDRMTVVVKAGQTENVQLQPAAGTKVLFAALTSTDYSGNVTYTALFGGAAPFPITAPQIVIGSAIVNQLNNNPNNVTLQNNAAKDATVDIFVLRVA